MKRFTFLAAMLLGTQLQAQTYNLLIGTYTNSGKSEESMYTPSTL